MKSLRLPITLIIAILLIIGVHQGLSQAADARWLAQEQIYLYGMGLTVEPAHQTVPKNIATIVSTYLQAPDLPAGQELPFPQEAQVHATLRGPSLESPLELVTGLNEYFEIPPLARAGLHSLENIRVVYDNKVVFYASPSQVSIEVIDKLLVTEITARPLTADEIRKQGIVFDQDNFQAYNFSAAFAVKPGEVININFPVVLAKPESVSDVNVPVVKTPQLAGGTLKQVSTIIPDTLTIAQTTLPNLTVKGFTLGFDEIVPEGLTIPPIPGVIVIPGDIGFLNQYFSVMLMVGNVAPEDSGLVVENLSAELSLPAGNDTVVGSGDDPLRMAVTEKGEYPRIQNISQPGPDGNLGTADDKNYLSPGDTGNAEFLVEGRREGSHTVEMEISGTLTGLPVGPVTIRGRAAGAVLVRNPNFTLTFTHPDIVNDGEEYDLDVTVTNTSESMANLVSINLYEHNISGATLIGEPTREFDTILPGDSASVSFRLRSHVTGSVYAATLDSDEKVAGRFELKTSVGELGIPLSPDSLVLPKEAGSLPADLRKASIGLLGKAYATATAPASALPADVKRFTKKMVWNRAVEVAEAGLRLSLHEPLADTAKQLLMDFMGSNYSRLNEEYPDEDQTAELEAAQNDFIGFDDLRRRSFRGDVFAEAVAATLSDVLASQGAASFHQDFAEKVSYRHQHLSVLVAADSGTLPFFLTLVDDQGNVLGGHEQDADKIIKQIPFGDFLEFKDAQGAISSQMALVSMPQGSGYTIRLTRNPDVPADAPCTFSVVLPADTESSLRQVVFSGITRETLPVVQPAAGDPFTIAVEMYENDQQISSSPVYPSQMQIITDPAPSVLGVVQQAEDDRVGCGGTVDPQLGRVVAVLFSEEVTAESVQDQFDRIDITHYAPEENKVVAVALQPGARIAFLALRDSLGPFIERQITISNISDRRGHAMESWTGVMEPTITAEGAVISGQVLNADGTPVRNAEVRLYFWNGLCDWHGVSAKNADAEGRYAWDFVLKNRKGKVVAIDPGTREFRPVEFKASRNGQRLNVNIVMLGRGTVSGRVLAEDGFTPLEKAQIKVTSLTDYSQYGATSDEQGRFVIPDVPVGSIMIEAVHTESNSSRTLSEYIPAAEEVLDLDLILVSEETQQITVEYGTLSGYVLESDGTSPVAGVPVVIYYKTGSQEGVACPHAAPPYLDCPVAFANTDETGAFSFEHIPAGELRVYTFEQARYIEGQARIQLLPDEDGQVNILLSGGIGTVSGIVLDADGNPVAGAEVGGGMSLTTTDDQGRFTLSDVPVGERKIVAVSQTLGSEGKATVNLVAEGEEVYATVVLAGLASVTGTVFEPDGTTPVAGMDVYLWYPKPDKTISVVATATTDADGHYRIDNIPIRDDYFLSAFLPDMSKGNIEPVELNFNGQVKRTDITCIGQGRIEGVVFDDNGQTPLEAQVSLSELQLVRAGPVGVRFQYVQHTRVTENNFTTGAFSFDNVYVGPITVATGGAFNLMCKTVDMGGGLPSDVLDPITYTGVMPHDGAVVDVTLQLQATSQIMGTVYESDGITPVGEGVSVTFRGFRIVCYPATSVCVEEPHGIQEETVVTDENGHYLLPLVTPWKFELVANDTATDKVGKAWGTTMPGQTAEVPIRLLGLGEVTVNVFASDGHTPVPNAQLDLEHAFIFEETLSLRQNFGFSTIERHGSADAGGTIIFNGGDAIPEGEFVVVARDPSTGFAGRASGKVTADGEQVALNVYLYDATGTVSGIVYEPDGITPAANAEVTISRAQDGYDLGFFVTDENGAYSFDLIPLGDFEITVFEPATGRRGFETARVDYAGQDTVVVITESPIGFITGTVMRSGDLSPLSGWDLELRQLNDRGEWITWRASSGPDGFFMFSGITLGTFELIAQQGENRAKIESRITREGETVDIPVVVSLAQNPMGIIEGIIYNPDGTPATNAEVCLDVCPPLGRGTTTDGYGAFRFTDVPLGRHLIRVSSQVSDDYGAALVDVDFAGRTAFTTIVLDGLGTISGIVEDQAGTPVPGARLDLYISPPLIERTVYTDENGEFTFIQLNSNRYTIVASDPITGLSGSSSVILALGQDEQARVVLEPTFSITGTVVSSDAAPVLGVMVTLEHLEHADPNNAGPLRLYAETGADGQFTFGAVPLGQCVIVFEDPVGIGYARRTQTVTDAIDLGSIVLDDAVPTVLTTDPAPGSVNVPMDQLVHITFSEQTNPGTINLNSVTLTGNDGQKVDGYLTVTDGDTAVTFTPLSELADETHYSLRLSANPPFAALDSDSSGSISRVEAARFFAVLVHFDEYDTNANGSLSEDEYPGGIEDRFGHVMAKDYVVPFTTVDITAPMVTDTSPAPSTGGVSVDSVIRVMFSEPVDPAAFAGQRIVLSSNQGNVDGRFDMILGNTGMVFTPTWPLTEDTVYHVSIPAATDLSGNVQTAGLEYDFTTTDRTAPVIAALDLSEGGTIIEGAIGTATVDIGASLDIAFVDFFINGDLVYTDRQAEFEMSFEALSRYGGPGDTINISAVATDTSGNRGDAIEGVFTIFADAVPTVSFASINPPAQAETGQRVEITIQAVDDLGLTSIAYQAAGGQFPAFGTLEVEPASTSSQADFAFYVPTDAVPGSVITVNASAVDTKEQVGQAASARITVLDATNPVVHFAGLTTGEQVVPGEVITAVVEATDIGGIASVTFAASGATVYSDTRVISPAQTSVASTFTFTLSPAALPTQNVTLEAVATDAAGNSSTRAQVILPVADLVPPVVSLDTATGLHEAAPGQTISLVADAGDETGVERVELSASGAITYFDAQQISPPSADTQAVFNVTIPDTANEGDTVTFEATAYDTSGNPSPASTLIISIRSGLDITLPSSIIMIAGEHQDITAELSSPAPADGVLITFASEDSSTATVQPSVTIAGGDTSGTFEVSPVRGGTTIINASIQGALRASMTVTVRGGVVTGTVLDQNLNPVGGADLTINGIVLTSEPDGTFFAEGVPGTDVVIRAFDPDTQFRGYVTGAMNEAGGYLRDVVVVLIPAGTVTGTVYLPDQQTLAGPGVQIDLYDPHVADPFQPPLQTTFTDEDSRFEFPLVAIGDYRVEVSDVEGNRGRTEVAIGAINEEKDIAVAFLGRSTVHVSVINGSGIAVPNAALTFSGNSIFGDDYRTETAGLDGTFEFPDIFIGGFSITALDPTTNMGARASGTISSDGEDIEVSMQTGQWASIEGTVYRADGTTPVPWAELMTTGYARATADENGHYRIDILPLGTYSVRATDDATRGIGRGEITLDTNGETATLDIDLLGQGTLVVTVEDYTGDPVSGAEIELLEKIEDGSFSRVYKTQSNENGLVVIDHVLEGQFMIMAKSDIYTSQWTYGEILPDQVLELTLTLEPTATLAGTVYGPDGVTPVENVKVRVVGGDTGWREYITGADGTYVFENCPLGTYLLEAYEGGTIDAFGNYAGGQLRAKIRDIPVTTPSETVTMDVTLVGLGTVTGQVFMPGGIATAPDMPLTLQSLTPDYGKTWSLRTDGAGYYTVERVPVGDFIVSSGDIDQGIYGEGQGSITDDGETVGVDIVLQNNAIALPQTLYDGNVVRFDFQEDGTIELGQNSLFSQYYYGTVKGGGVLEIVSGGMIYPFDGGEVPSQESMGREIVVRQNDLAGLNITRKIYVPQEGYFARYLEIVSNPTNQPITADIAVTSNLNYTLVDEFHIITTSSGDDAIQIQGVETPDTWVVIDDNNPEDPFLVPSSNQPPMALVWAGPDAEVAPESVEFIQRTDDDHPARVAAQWSQVTLNPGETKAFMHCIVQQLSREAARASAERLAALPPELLAGMSLAEMGMVQNFSLPTDGSSTLSSLPKLSGTVSGQVLASDGVTPAPSGYTTDILIKSDSIYFGRTYITHPDATGDFLYESDLTGTPSYSDVLGIPLDGFTLSARVCRGSYCSYDSFPQYYVLSPQVNGMLSNEQLIADVDIVFSNTGIIEGTITRATGAVVSGAHVSIDMSPYSVDVETAQDGSYRAAFLAPGIYEIGVAVEGVPDQGSLIRAEASGTVEEGLITTVDISLPPLGTISGLVTGPDGSPLANARVDLSETEGASFSRETRTDTAGRFTLTDIPVGIYTVTAYDPATNGPLTFTVTVDENQTSTVDFPMPVFTRLPTTLTDGSGYYSWDIQTTGNIRYGTDSAYDYTGLSLDVNGYSFGGQSTAVVEEDGRELLIGPYTQTYIGAIRIFRKVYVPDDDSFIRYLEIIENTGAEEISAEVLIESRLGSGNATQVIDTSRPDGLFDAMDDYIITDDAADGSGTPSMTHVFSGPGAAIEPSTANCPFDNGYTLYPNYLRYSYDVTIPGGECIIIMHFAAQNATRADALASAENLHCLQGSALNGLSDDEKQDIVNFIPVIDSDGDGLNDGREAELGTDSNLPDSDGDGLLDGFEVKYGYNPLLTGEETDDPDNDGLDNLAEQAAYTDPNNPDTDGGGLWDGDEILLGTNPLNPSDDLMQLPLTLTDSKGFPWDIQRDGCIRSISDGPYYYCGLDLRIDDSFFPSFATGGREDMSREITIGPYATGDIEVHRKVFVPDDDAFVRYLEIVENTSATETVTTTLHIDSDLGSRSDTQVIATSSGDVSFSTEDTFIITDDENDGSGNPAMVHLFSGKGANEHPVAVETTAPGDNDLWYDFELTLAPGERKIIMHFASQNLTRADAEASAGRISCLQGSALSGLAADELADIVNFVPVIDSDCDGLNDEEETIAGTGPNNPDSDGDGLLDGFEVAYSFNPLSPGEENGDPDNDALDNLTEQALGTNPNNPDSDGDGFTDGDEVNVFGTDPTSAVIRITRGAAPSDQADLAIDSHGNIHVVWVDDRHNDGDHNDEIYYTLLNSAGGTLIDDTRLTTDTARSRRPAIAIDTQNRAHIVWQDKRLNNTPEIFYTLIDPSLHAQDGSPGDDAVMAVVDDTLLSADDGDKGDTPRLTVDSQDRVHVVWAETDRGEIQYARLEADATAHSVNVSISRPIFSAGESRWYPAHTDLALDSDENVHVIWLDHRDTWVPEIFYEMLDHDTGATLIDETVLTADDGNDALYPSLSMGPGDEITVAFGDYRLSTSEGFMMRINPAWDDQDGSTAQASEIIVLPETPVTPDDDVTSGVPTGRVDTQGNLHMTYFDTLESWNNYPAELHLLVADSMGATITDTILTQGPSAVTNGTDWTRAHLAAHGITSYVTWTDNRYGNAEVLLRILNPDRDQDGLIDADELTAGTDPDDPDTDNDGLLDGFEVRNGFDPLAAGEQNQDPDGDTLNNLQEQAAGTDPNLTDTDADGLDDGDELTYGADPNRADTDNDGLIDGDEVHTWHSSPTLIDTDGDGLLDGFEAANGFDPSVAGEETQDPDTDGLDNLAEQDRHTDPNISDTDADGLNDGDEVNTWSTDPLDPDTDDDALLDGFETSYGMNPLTAGDETLDPDNDNLPNLQEQTAGTNPQNPDTDGDGLRDGFEVQYGLDPLVTGDETEDPDSDGLTNLEEQTLGTDPTNADSDWDMLDDGDEINTYHTNPVMWDSDMDQLGDGDEVNGTNGYVTDPANPDTDGGGRRDGDEVMIDGTDPTNPADDQVPIPITEGEGTSDHSAVAIDSTGNIHVVFQDDRTGNFQIYYTMLSPDKSTLIDDTRLTGTATSASRPALVVDNLDVIHVVWQDAGTSSDEIYHMAIDPSLDDRDGSAADAGEVTVIAPHLISTDDGVASTDLQVASDTQGRLNIVWEDTDVGQVHYTRIADDGTIQIADQVIFDAGSGLAWGRALPTVAVDANDDVHIAWMDRPSNSIEIFYAMLDGGSADGGSATTLIDTTELTPSDGYDTRYPSLGIGPGNEVSLVFDSVAMIPFWGSYVAGCQVVMLRIDPSLDDQNGDAAAVGSITALAETPIVSQTFATTLPPSATTDAEGNVYVCYYNSYSETSVPPRGSLSFVVLDFTGSPITSPKYLTDGTTATTTETLTMPAVAIDDSTLPGTGFMTWTDNRSGNHEILLRIIEPTDGGG